MSPLSWLKTLKQVPFGHKPNGTYFRLFSHGVAAAGSPRRKPWDMFASKPLAPDGAAARFAPFSCTQNLSPSGQRRERFPQSKPKRRRTPARPCRRHEKSLATSCANPVVGEMKP